MSHVNSKIFGYNQKMEDTEKANPGTAFYNFNTTPGVTCPQKGACWEQKWCYAINGNYNRWSVKKKMEANYELSKSDEFVSIIDKELSRLQQRMPDIKIYIRWNDAGDIYDEKYFKKLIEIAEHNPDVNFYSYTKSVGLVKDAIANGLVIPENYRITFSVGGKQDHLITEDDRQAKVIGTYDEVEEGWHDAAHNDKITYDNAKIALKYHGQRRFPGNGKKV